LTSKLPSIMKYVIYIKYCCLTNLSCTFAGSWHCMAQKTCSMAKMGYHFARAKFAFQMWIHAIWRINNSLQAQLKVSDMWCSNL
jgi:hypothetical protein